MKKFSDKVLSASADVILKQFLHLRDFRQSVVHTSRKNRQVYRNWRKKAKNRKM